MLGRSAVIFLPDDTGKTGFSRPLMLQSVLGAPLLTWLGASLYADGVSRFFLICQDRFVAEAVACLPAEAECMTGMDRNSADLLHVFLSTAEEEEEQLPIIAGPMIYAPGLARRSGTPRSAVCYRADRFRLMDALDENFSFSHFLRDNCAVLSDYDGYFSVDSLASALRMGELLRQDQMLRLIKNGVEIYDGNHCYVDPTVRVESGAKLLPGTMLRGSSVIRADAVIGPWSVISDSEIGSGSVICNSHVEQSKVAAGVHVGPYAHIRPDSVLEKGVRIGNFVEVKNSTVGENTWASHLSYIGDAQVGARCNLGCGTVTVNFDRAEKHPSVIEDEAFIGCNSALIAPIHVGRGAYVAAGSTLTGDVPDHALAIARGRQSNKKDWAAKHKLPKNE